MIAEATDYLALIENIPIGKSILLTHISWDEYNEILDQLERAGRPGVRVTYDQGKVEIMPTSIEHEDYKDFIFRVACALAEELDVMLETKGNATFQMQIRDKGVEPDTCFYIQHAEDIIGLKRFKYGIDTPPDVAVEIDITSPSLSKFPIYVALDVSEIWHYNGRKARFYALVDEAYQEVSASRALPILTAEALTQFLEQSKTDGQTKTLKAFRAWARGQKDRL